MNTHPEIDMHRIRALLDRMDPAPRRQCTVEGCTHSLPHAGSGRAGGQTPSTAARSGRAHAKAA